MQKRLLMPALALILGVIGAVVHRFELADVFKNGVLQEFSPLTIVLIVLLIAAVTCAVLTALSVPKGALADKDYAGAFPSNLGLFIIDALCGIAFISASGYGFLYGGGEDMASRILLILCTLSGLSIVVLGYTGYKGKENPLTGPAGLIICVFFAFFMAVTYRDSAGSPSLLSYCWFVLTLGIITISWYCVAGFAFKHQNARKTLFILTLSVFLSAAFLGETREPWQMALVCSNLIVSALNIYKMAAFIQ